MTIKELENKWNTIDPYTNGYLLISGEHPLSFHIGYYGGEQKSFVVINTGKIDGIKSSKAITAECLNTGSHNFIFRFVLNYASLDEIFVKLCWDLIESSKSSQNPVKQIQNQYDKWMNLLQKATEDILPPSQQKGLIGELLFLQETLNILEPAQTINAWVGPDGNDQDFIFEHSWAEVKAVTIAATEVQISSLQQLDRLDAGYLIVYFLDKTTSIGTQTTSLPIVIQQIQEQLPNDFLRDCFHCKLTQYGYLFKDENKYLSIRYHLSECRKYKVIGDFPKLIRNNVSHAIVNAKYQLSLIAIEDSRVWGD